MILEAYQLFTSQPFVANPASGGPSIPISQTITGSTTSIVSTNDINLKATPYRDIGIGGRALYVIVEVTTAFVGSTNLVINLQQSANAGAGPYTFLWQVGVIPINAPVGGPLSYQVDQVQPLLITQQYLSLSFQFAGVALTQGAVCAFITPDPDLTVQYAVNYVVSTK
jgi:hypothetical protein